MKQLLMIFLAVCTLHTVLSAETIPKNASGFIPADKITAYYWEEQVFSLPLSYVRSIMEDLYVEHGHRPSFFHF